jgi:SAM-dependent methyltransferase
MRYTADNYANYLDWKVRSMLALLESRGADLEYAKVLDFGCQHGTSVEALRSASIDAYGFDIGEPNSTGYIRQASIENYHIPWPDSTFDVVFSHHVFEHVMDHDVALKELRRVLKPKGIMLHVFPSRWRLMEAHFYTPFGGVINNRLWCTFWGWIRKPGRKHIPLLEYGTLASATIRNELCYPPRKQLFKDFGQYFTIESAVGEYFKILKGRSIPAFMASLVSELHVRVLIARPIGVPPASRAPPSLKMRPARRPRG